MERWQGIGASEGIAIGPAWLLAKRAVVRERWLPPAEIARELKRLQTAVVATDRELLATEQMLASAHDESTLLLVRAHRLMLNSDELCQGIAHLIGEGLAPESAVRRVVDDLVATFATVENPVFRDRGEDVEAVGERLLRNLLGLPDLAVGRPAAGHIAVGSMLSAIDVLHLQRAGLVGAATEHGGKNAHTAILLRAFELPYVLDVDGLTSRVSSRALIVIDGGEGTVIVDPDMEVLCDYRERLRADRARTRRRAHARTWSGATADGTVIEVAANIERLEDIPKAIARGAESVGLFRTEFLYLDRDDLPSEDEQCEDAIAALAAAGGRPITFRTLDLGGDKMPPKAQLPVGPNPSLGVRSIRFSARRPDVLRTQLRALYRASIKGPMRIMFPMVSDVCELQQAVAACAHVRRELRDEGVAHDETVPIGTMIETPSAALTTDHLSDHSDFFSIGTNDLIQYTLAADRDNDDVGYLYKPLHPAVLRLIQTSIAAADAARRPISICGDMAGDPMLTPLLLGLGARALSMASRYLSSVRAMVAETRIDHARALANEVLALRSEEDVHAHLERVMRQGSAAVLVAPASSIGTTSALPRHTPPWP